jgi:hypothetical protein
VVYTGRETRASMNTSEPESKVGLLDIEINKMAKVSTSPVKIQIKISLAQALPRRSSVLSPSCCLCYW